MTKTSRSTVLPSPASSVDPPLRRPRRRPPAAVSLATATLCALSTSSAAHAAGGAAHVVAGQLARDQLQDAELKALLKKHEGAYLHGTLYPDAILQLLQLAEKIGGQQGQYTSDDWSHGIKQSAAEPPKGVMAHYWQEFWKKCPDGATTDECGVALAFFMGIVTHLVTDGPWHNEFIDRSADLCEAPLSPMPAEKPFWANPGGLMVAREASGEVSGWGRHLVADKDFDGCLSAALRGWPSLLGDMKGVIPGNPLIYAPAKFLRKVAPLKTAKAQFRRELALTCAVNQFANAGDTNNCYSCPSGFTHNILKKVDETGVCTRSWNDERKGNYQGKASFFTCPSGQWVGGDSCYTCDSGYSHNGWLTADTKGVCYKNGVDDRKATFEKKLTKQCPSGEFPNVELSGCYACPAGYVHNPAFPVGQDGVCIEARAKMCDSGFFDLRQGGECWSCPAGYLQNGFPVDTGMPCARPGILACKDVTPPAGKPRVTPGDLPKSMLPFTLLKSAYDADGLTTWKLFEANFTMLDWTELAKKALPKSKITPVTVKVDGGFPAQGHKDLINNYPRMFAQRDQVAPELFALPESAVCSKMIAGAITRKGGLNDSAAASARFMDAIWKERQSKAAATVIRVDNFEYAIVKDKQVLYRSTARSCETSRECGGDWPSVCVDGECHRSEMKAAEAGMDRLYYMFVNKASGLCLDPKGYDGGSGKNVGMFRCEGRFDQVFQMTRRASGSYGRLLTANGNACLDVQGYDGAAGKNVGLYTCEDLDDQAWNIADAGDARWRSSEDGATGWVQVKNLMQGTCLASEGNAESDANVRVEACDAKKATQLWVPIEVNTRGQASHVLVHKGLGGCLDPDGAEAASSSDVAIRRCNGSEDQLFLLGEGDAIARNQRGLRSNICLDVKGNDGAVGRTIGLYTCDDGADQKWSAAPKTGGWKQVKNPKASTCLDVVKEDVQLGKCVASLDSQQWATVPIPTWPAG